jgi:putative tricarboxylic transport membrane protein
MDVYFGGISLSVLLFFHTVANKLGPGSRVFPVLFLYIAEIISALILISGIRNTFRNKDNSAFGFSFQIIKFPLLYYCFILLYAIGIFVIGFFVSTTIFVVVSMILMKYRRKMPIICTTIGVITFVYLVFVVVLSVRMPQALLF